MKVTNISYISYLLTQKNNQLKLSSMTDFARSKRKLISMEGRHSIDSMLNYDTFTKSRQQEEKF